MHGHRRVGRELRRVPELSLDLTPHLVDEPDAARLKLVAIEHKLDQNLNIDLADLAEDYMRAPRPSDQPRNVAEFLDYVRAWCDLELSGDEATRAAVLEAISGRASR